jgi:hypothetical protein
MSPDDPAAMELYKKGIEIWMKNLPTLPYMEYNYEILFSTKYWVGWPTMENLYAPPPNWWPEFRFIIFNIRSRTAPQVIQVPIGLEEIGKSISNLAGNVTTLSGRVDAIGTDLKALSSQLGMMITGIVIEAIAVIILAAILAMAMRKK